MRVGRIRADVGVAVGPNGRVGFRPRTTNLPPPGK
ncbi:hypothetical protein ElP_39270 [Tautonia plasticadhaerens]|uniref:Uncharacterized protein n=1 Tax=Tautonia plasticadhaerens TaxID=2527974 RepID=A0A518H5A3_9BACT|nr:hypothetical protein ElP_39270 [Tautonia plasticadhaerens]